MIEKTKGLIIKRSNVKDNDVYVTILTPNGKIEAIGKGAKKEKSRLMAGTQYFCFGEFVIFKGTNTNTLNSADPIEIFYNLRLDIEKLEVVSKICKIINYVTDENQDTFEILRLCLNTLYLLNKKNECDLDFIFSIFLFSIIKDLGFSPILDNNCSICNEKEDETFFSIKNKGLICRNCKNEYDKSAIKITENVKNGIRYVINSDCKKIYNFSLSEDDKKTFELISKLYFEDCIDFKV